MRLKEYLDIIVEEVKGIKTEVAEQGKVQIKQQLILDEHIRRSEANEKAVQLLEEKLKDSVTWSQLLKILTTSGVGLGVLTGVLKLLGKI